MLICSPPRISAAALVGALALFPACSSSLPRPPGGVTPADEAIEVPYPPPAARAEMIPPQKSAETVWLDGQWEWDGKAWKWRDGAWTNPPAGAFFTPWTTTRRADGQLLFTRAEWRDKAGRPLNAAVDGQICAVKALAIEVNPR